MTISPLLVDARPRVVAGHLPDRLLLIAHGSPDVRHAQGVRGLAAAVATEGGVPTDVAFLEHDEPTAVAAMTPSWPKSAAPTHRKRTTVVPLLLTAGTHWRRDIPVVLGHHGDETRLVAPPRLAHFAVAVHALLDGTGDAPVVIASAGSRNPALPQRLSDLAATLGDERPVEIATHPDQVAGLAGPGSVVVPLVIADGIFADRIRAVASDRGASVTRVLGETPEFARALARLALAAG